MGRLRHEAGQTVVLVAVLLPLFLGLGALAVDIGYWYVVKKTAQDAADAAALAAAAELPVKSAAEAAAATYVTANMPEATWRVEYPYVPDVVGGEPPPSGISDPPAPPIEGTPDPTKVEVIVERRADTLFGRIFAMFETVIVSRAVAERKPVSGNLAIFAHSYQSCDDGLEIDAVGVRVDGHIHSNGQYDVHSGFGADALLAADGTIWRDNCVSNLDPEPEGAKYGPGPDFLPRDVWRMASWPLWHRPADFGWPSCSGANFNGQRIEMLAAAIRIVDADGERMVPHAGVIPTGTYCATESLTIRASNVRGTITAVAPEIAVDGSNLELAAHERDVLFFEIPNPDALSNNDGDLGHDGNPDCTPDTGYDLVLDGAHHEWAGVVFNPCGRVVLNTSDSRLEGAVIAKSVLVTGDRSTLTGTATLPGPVGLVE